MSLMYPLHVPEVPLKWDDPAWVAPVPITNEAALIKLYADKLANRKAKETLAHFTEAVCNLVTQESDEDRDEADD